MNAEKENLIEEDDYFSQTKNIFTKDETETILKLASQQPDPKKTPRQIIRSSRYFTEEIGFEVFSLWNSKKISLDLNIHLFCCLFCVSLKERVV